MNSSYFVGGSSGPSLFFTRGGEYADFEILTPFEVKGSVDFQIRDCCSRKSRPPKISACLFSFEFSLLVKRRSIVVWSLRSVIMKKFYGVLMVCGLVSLLKVDAQVVRVALSDFEVTAGQVADRLTAGGTTPATMADQGAFLLGKNLVNQGGFELVDRRDMQKQLTDSESSPVLLRAAQQLNADVLLEGEIQSFSTRKQTVRQGGYESEHQELQLRVGIEARDTVSGSVVAMASGSSRAQIRQTANVSTQLGEEDLLNLLDEAIQNATPEITKAIERHRDQLANREVINLSISTGQDPALVEIDGLLVGTTPIQNLPVYRGDHVITIGKAGHRDIIKKVKLDQDTKLQVDLIRTELNADEIKEILSGARLSGYFGLEPALIIEQIQ